MQQNSLDQNPLNAIGQEYNIPVEQNKIFDRHHNPSFSENARSNIINSNQSYQSNNSSNMAISPINNLSPQIPPPVININNLNQINTNEKQNSNDNLININNNENQEKEKETSETKIECNKIFGELNPYQSKSSNKVILLTKTYNLNIIFYDDDLNRTQNNNFYCSYFKSQLEGAFYGINNFNLFKYICHKIQQNPRQFILISSGSCADKVFGYCTAKNIKQIYMYYIYCFDNQNYYPLMQKYPKVKNILKTFNDLKRVITDNQPVKNTHIRSSNLIFLSDYNRTFIKLHYEIIRKYSLYKIFKSKNYDKTKFLELINNKFPYYENMAKELIFNDDDAMVKFFRDTINEPEEILRKVFNSNHDIKEYISNYTIESFYYRNLNRFLRSSDFKSFRILSNHISKFIYHLYEYRKTHMQYNNATLYRNMTLTWNELNLYFNSIGKIICYPSFTSTTLKRNGYNPFIINPNTIPVELIIQQNNSPSIISIRELSNLPNEEEYLCLPFTFFKITNVENNMGNNIIYLTALRSEKPIEDMLLEFMENETDNLDPEGLQMIRVNEDEVSFYLNPCLKAEIYKNYIYDF